MQRTATLLCLLTAAGGGSAIAAADRTPSRPNILVIMTDEHHAGIMGCAGDRIVRTPHLDALAAHGVMFTSHYCASPICTPTRQTFTTGKYVSQHGVWGNTVGVPDSWPTLPKILATAGYEPFLIGKMHYKGGRTYGFTLPDRKAVEKGSTATSESPPSKPRHRLPAGQFPDQGDRLGDEFHPLGAVDDMDGFVDVQRRDAAVSFLEHRQAGDKPMLLVVGLIAPHYPLVAPPDLVAHYRDRVPMPDIPAGHIDALPLNYKHLRNDRRFEHVPPDTVKLARESYYARVEWTDQQIGAILDALKRSAIADDTVVIYTSDHGESLGEHGLWWKNCMFDGAARIPLIISWPGRWQGGQRRTGACGLVDLVQTICSLAGARPPADWNGSTMQPWLDDPACTWKDQAVCEYYSGYTASGMVMIRQGAWKYVYHARADAQTGPERELYDLSGDPREFRNRARDPDQAGRLAAMHAALVAELGEDPERTEARWRAGATPEQPEGLTTAPVSGRGP